MVKNFLVSNNLPAGIKLSFHAISDPSNILELEDVLDTFVNKWSKNPFSLSGFNSKFIGSNGLRGWTRFVLVVKTNEKIIATAPLVIKKRLGIRFAEFFPSWWFSPDFVVDEGYHETCMRYVVEYLFKTLKCRFARFYLPVESTNLETIEQQCKIHGIGFSAKNQSRHRILPVEGTWDEFQEKKGRRRIIRQIERKLNQIGPWKIEYVENVSNRQDVLKMMLDVEKMSWKESWRNRMRIATDEELLMVWEGSQIVARTKKDFKCSVWFLRVNSETVAYTFVIKYNGIAFLTKTSYDDRFRKFYVGKYVMNIAISNMFNEGQIRTIDFMTDIPFMSAWTSWSLDRVRVFMWKGNVAALAERLLSNNYMLSVLKRGQQLFDLTF
jgi:hypothetical protein